MNTTNLLKCYTITLNEIDVIKELFGISFLSIRVNLIYEVLNAICTYYSCCILYMASALAVHECFARVTIYSFIFNVFKICRNLRLFKIFLFFFILNFIFDVKAHRSPNTCDITLTISS